MEIFLNRLWNLQPGELRLVLTLGFALLGNSLAQKVTEIASISHIVTDVGVPQLLIVLVISSGISLVMTGIQSLLVDRFNRVTLLCTIGFGLAVAFVVLRLLFILRAPIWLNYGLGYLLSEQQFTFFPLVFWVLANDMFEVAQTKRLFPLLASWGLIGNLIGIMVTAISPKVFTELQLLPEELLMLNILLYLLIYFLLVRGLPSTNMRTVRYTTDSIQETLAEGREFIREIPAFRYLTLSILTVIICETIIDFRFYVVLESTFKTVNHYQVFFSLFTLSRVIAYLAIQSFLTQRIIAAIHLKNTFLLTPFTSLAASICTIAIPGLTGTVLGVAVQKLPQYTIDETARKTFQGFVPEERRGRVSLFMDSYLIAIGSTIGAVLIGITILIGNYLKIPQFFYAYLSIAIVSALVASIAALKMRSVYDASLLNWRLRRRQRGKSILDKLDF
jgi:ATP:ADP antiporter, AAA family